MEACLAGHTFQFLSNLKIARANIKGKQTASLQSPRHAPHRRRLAAMSTMITFAANNEFFRKRKRACGCPAQASQLIRDL